MYLLVREFQPAQAIELGTNVGISSAYQAAGLQTNASGRLVTLEASPYRLRLAKELHGRVGLRALDYRQGLFTETLDDAVADFGPFDFVFIDGHHQYEPTLDYFERVWRRSHDDALFVFDDIRWSEGMQRAWAKLQADPRVALALDLYTVGVCVVAREPQTRRCVLTPFRYALECA
jgi:predicted O-methyltransferase YrrM